MIAGHSNGVLKGSNLGLIGYAAGLVVAFVPLGFAVYRSAQPLSRRFRYGSHRDGSRPDPALRAYHLLFILSG